MKQQSFTNSIGKNFFARAGIRLKPLACFVFLLSLCLTPLTAQGQDISVGNITITASGDYVITGTTTTNRIIVATGVTANITLNNVNINVSGTAGACAFEIAPGAIVNLTLDGVNTISSGPSSSSVPSRAGIEVPLGATLTIDGFGTLTANGGNDTSSGGGGAGIGSSGGLNAFPGDSSGDIFIYGGTITANGGSGGSSGGGGGAGIGGGGGGNSGTGGGAVGNIVISGGDITANGGTGGQNGGGGTGIGGGGGGKDANGGNYGYIIITGGDITIKGGGGGGSAGGGGAAGIGGGGGGGNSSQGGYGGHGNGDDSGIIIFPNVTKNITGGKTTSAGGTASDGPDAGTGGGHGLNPNLGIPTTPSSTASISILNNPKLSYLENESLDLSGLILEFDYGTFGKFNIPFASLRSFITTSPPHGITLNYSTHNGQNLILNYSDGTNTLSNIVIGALTVDGKLPVSIFDFNVALPVACEPSQKTVSDNTDFNSTISWDNGNPDYFDPNTEYTVSITLIAAPGYTFGGTTNISEFTINNETPTSAITSTDFSELVVTMKFPKTAKPIITTTVVEFTLDDPVTCATAPASVSSGTFSADVDWGLSAGETTFAAGTVYTATVSLTAPAGETFCGFTETDKFLVNNNEGTVNSDGTKIVFTVTFPATTVLPAAIAGVTPPAAGATPVTAITATEYTGTVVWTPNDSQFDYDTEYTAVITVTPETGYTLECVTADYFTVAGATTVTNAASSGVITAVFPKTNKLVPDIIDFAVTPPASNDTPQSAVTPTDGTGFENAILEWDPSTPIFAFNTVYTSVITLKAKSGYTFTGYTGGGFTINGNAPTEVIVSPDGSTLTLKYTFPATLANLSASLDPTVAIFPVSTYGYDISEIAPQVFTLTNTGAGKITGLTATLYSGAGSPFVMIDDWSTTSIDAGGTATISFRPKPGLPISSTPYADALIVHWNEDGGGGCFATLNFSVLYRKEITVKPNEGSSYYGQSPANPGFKANGLVNGDTEAVLVGLYTNFYITSTTHADPYLIEVEGELESNSNYIVVHRYSGLWRVYKLAGAEVERPAIVGDPTDQEITVTSVGIPINPGNQTVEYAISTIGTLTNVNTLTWQSETTFTGDFSESDIYYVYARSKENTNYLAGAVKVSLPITDLIKTGFEDIQQVKSLNARIQDGVLHVSGLTAGKPWSVYNLAGMLLYRGIAKSDVETQRITPMQNHGVYIVLSDGRTVKVIF